MNDALWHPSIVASTTNIIFAASDASQSSSDALIVDLLTFTTPATPMIFNPRTWLCHTNLSTTDANGTNGYWSLYDNESSVAITLGMRPLGETWNFAIHTTLVHFDERDVLLGMWWDLTLVHSILYVWWCVELPLGEFLVSQLCIYRWGLDFGEIFKPKLSLCQLSSSWTMYQYQHRSPANKI